MSHHGVILLWLELFCAKHTGLLRHGQHRCQCSDCAGSGNSTSLHFWLVYVASLPSTPSRSLTQLGTLSSICCPSPWSSNLPVTKRKKGGMRWPGTKRWSQASIRGTAILFAGIPGVVVSLDDIVTSPLQADCLSRVLGMLDDHNLTQGDVLVLNSMENWSWKMKQLTQFSLSGKGVGEIHQ